MYYEFICDNCNKDQREDWNGTLTVKAPMSTGPGTPTCDRHGAMRRIYTTLESTIQLDRVGYIEKAYRGEELPPGMTQKQVQAIVDTHVAPTRAGRANRPRKNIVQ